MAVAEIVGGRAPSWREMVPGRFLKTLRLTRTEHDVWLALCDLQAGVHKEVFGGALAITKAIDPETPFVKRRTTTGRSYLEHPRLKQVTRCLFSLRVKRLIRLKEVGGGRYRASSYVLGPAVEEFWESEKQRRLRVVPNRDANVPVSGPQNRDANVPVYPLETGTSMSLPNRDANVPASSSFQGFSTPSTPTPKDEREGRPASRLDHGPFDPDDQPRTGELTPLGSILPRLDLQRSLDPPGQPSALAGGVPDEAIPPPLVFGGDRAQGDEIVDKALSLSDSPVGPLQDIVEGEAVVRSELGQVDQEVEVLLGDIPPLPSRGREGDDLPEGVVRDPAAASDGAIVSRQTDMQRFLTTKLEKQAPDLELPAPRRRRR